MRFAYFLFAACVACNAIDGADQYKKGDGGTQTGCPSSCTSAAEGCLSACTSTHNSCVTACNNPPCVTKCDNDYSTCNDTCTSTCTMCEDGGCTLAQCTTFDAGID